VYVDGRMLGGRELSYQVTEVAARGGTLNHASVKRERAGSSTVRFVAVARLTSPHVMHTSKINGGGNGFVVLSRGRGEVNAVACVCVRYACMQAVGSDYIVDARCVAA